MKCQASTSKRHKTNYQNMLHSMVTYCTSTTTSWNHLLG